MDSPKEGIFPSSAFESLIENEPRHQSPLNERHSAMGCGFCWLGPRSEGPPFPKVLVAVL